MGMFDYLYYEGKEYQSKDTPRQALDKYKIEKDQDSGHDYLWVEEYDSEWVEDKDRFLGGYIHQFNERWIRCDDFDGAIDFYRTENKGEDWIEYHSLFMNGKMIKFEELKPKDDGEVLPSESWPFPGDSNE
jgi:hypothetical protein